MIFPPGKKGAVFLKVDTFEEFIGQVRTHMQKRYPSREVLLKQVTKNNGVRKGGLIIQEMDTRISPTIYLDGFYQEYLKGMPLTDVLRSVEETYEDALCEDFRILDFYNFSAIRGQICFRLMNRERNKELLKTLPHREVMDMALIYTVEMENGKASTKIHDSLMRLWGIGEEELYRLARKNTPVLFQGSVVSMETILKETLQEDEALSEDPLPECGLFVATNRQKIYGAAVLLYEGCCEGFARRVGSSFYILPSSVHELLFLPEEKGMSPEELKAMVKEINETQVAPEEVLSDNVYYYEADTGNLRQLTT